MDEGEVAPDCGGEALVDPAREKLGLPQREAFGRQVVHGEQACLGILGQHMRHGVRQPARDRAQITRLSGVALDRRLPQRGDLQPRERPLDAEAPPAGLDEADVGRDAASQRRDADRFARPCEAEAAQGLFQFSGLGGWLALVAHVFGPGDRNARIGAEGEALGAGSGAVRSSRKAGYRAAPLIS